MNTQEMTEQIMEQIVTTKSNAEFLERVNIFLKNNKQISEVILVSEKGEEKTIQNFSTCLQYNIAQNQRNVALF